MNDKSNVAEHNEFSLRKSDLYGVNSITKVARVNKHNSSMSRTYSNMHISDDNIEAGKISHYKIDMPREMSLQEPNALNDFRNKLKIRRF